MAYGESLISDHIRVRIEGFATNFSKLSVLGAELKAAYEDIKLALALGSKYFVLESDNNEIVNMLQGKLANTN